MDDAPRQEIVGDPERPAVPQEKNQNAGKKSAPGRNGSRRGLGVKEGEKSKSPGRETGFSIRKREARRVKLKEKTMGRRGRERREKHCKWPAAGYPGTGTPESTCSTAKISGSIGTEKSSVRENGAKPGIIRARAEQRETKGRG